MISQGTQGGSPCRSDEPTLSKNLTTEKKEIPNED